MDAGTDKRQVLFIHGGGEGGYEVDAKLAASLQEALGTGYHVRYPKMPSEDAPDFGWCQQIGEEIVAIKGEVILVGHSLGASMLLLSHALVTKVIILGREWNKTRIGLECKSGVKDAGYVPGNWPRPGGNRRLSRWLWA